MIASLLKYAPVQVISALSVFALIAVHTHFLTPEYYGVLAVAMVVLELVRAFSTQWLNTSMLRLYPVVFGTRESPTRSNYFIVHYRRIFAWICDYRCNFIRIPTNVFRAPTYTVCFAIE